MIAMSSARSASTLSAVKPNQTRPYVISRPLQARPPKPAGDSADDWATLMSAYRNDRHGRTSCFTNVEKRRRTYVKTAHVLKW